MGGTGREFLEKAIDGPAYRRSSGDMEGEDVPGRRSCLRGP